MTKARVVKFCTQVGYIGGNRLPSVGHGQSHMTHFNFSARHRVFGMGEARHFKFGVPIGIDEC